MAKNVLSPADFLQESQTVPVIDVRSPAEYEHAHIPNAINVPLFNNEERAKVGTCYKQLGRDAAVRLGLKLIGPKLAYFVEQADEIAPHREVLVHCWRRNAEREFCLVAQNCRLSGANLRRRLQSVS